MLFTNPISRLLLVFLPVSFLPTCRCIKQTEPIQWTSTLTGSYREVFSSWFSSTLQPPLMGEQWLQTKAVYTVQTQPWAAAHWLILQCVWERRGTPFSSFVPVSVNSVVGGRSHCGGQCYVLTQSLVQLVPRVQPEDSWIMERGCSSQVAVCKFGSIKSIAYIRQVKIESPDFIFLIFNAAASLNLVLLYLSWVCVGIELTDHLYVIGGGLSPLK